MDERTITSGSLILKKGSEWPRFIFVGETFLILNEVGEPGSARAFDRGYRPGDTINLDANFGGSYTFGYGPASVDGHIYPKLYYLGSIELEGEALIDPHQFPIQTASGHFTLSGSLNGHVKNPFVNDTGEPPTFDFSLNGHGTATLEFHPPAGEGDQAISDVKRVIYRFEE